MSRDVTDFLIGLAFILIAAAIGVGGAIAQGWQPW